MKTLRDLCQQLRNIARNAPMAKGTRTRLHAIAQEIETLYTLAHQPCWKMQPTEDRRLGGPRNVCTLPRGHAGECGNWKWMSQFEHGREPDVTPKE